MVGICMNSTKKNKNKFSFIVSINMGYMFSLISTMNAMKYFGTNADFHCIYIGVDQEFRDKVSNAFPFNVFWIPLSDFSGDDYFNVKYHYLFSDKFNDFDYDAVSIIDGDLFLCCNMNEYFEMIESRKFDFISATHKHSDLSVDYFKWDDYININDRSHCLFADFPAIFDFRKSFPFIGDWYHYTKNSGGQISHPLIAMNRAVAKNFKKDKTLPLDGDIWVCDKNYWRADYSFDNNLIMRNDFGIVKAIHNRWWKDGRANAEIRNNRNVPNVGIGIKNMNTIRDYMAKFNDMTPEVKADNYIKEIFNVNA